MRKEWLGLAAAAAASALAAAAAANDTVSVSNSAGGEVGLLVDGQDGGGAVDDRGFVSGASPIDVGQLSSGANNEVIAFNAFRPPQHAATAWTGGDDAFTVAFAPKIRVPVTVWIVKGPFADQRTHAVEACIRTSAIWNAERVGVAFSTFEVLDATGDPDAPSHYAFPNGDAGDAVWKPLRDDIGFKSDRLNIYWVDTVDGNTTSGWSNFGQQIAMGRNTGDELLSHEIGHAFGLTHTDTHANFDQTGVMHSASNTRAYLSEGQLYRAHMDPDSVLNATYAARPGEPTRDCSLADESATCPAIDRRLWADGTFPAN